MTCVIWADLPVTPADSLPIATSGPTAAPNGERSGSLDQAERPPLRRAEDLPTARDSPSKRAANRRPT